MTCLAQTPAVLRSLTGACAVVAVGAALLLWASPAAWAAAALAPRAPAATLSDCQHLLRQFDVAWASHRDSARAAAARLSRDQGETECQQRRYADGVHHLRRALHDLGLKPVKVVARAPQR